jgi:LysM repeat protein
MTARKSGRYLALLALVGVAIATALVVRAGLATTHHVTKTAATATPSTRRPASRRRFYVVRPGDSLSRISVKTGVSVTELQSLNPNETANPNALQAGQRLRLRP